MHQVSGLVPGIYSKIDISASVNILSTSMQEISLIIIFGIYIHTYIIHSGIGSSISSRQRSKKK